eukprot:Rmarinus@m.6425
MAPQSPKRRHSLDRTINGSRKAYDYCSSEKSRRYIQSVGGCRTARKGSKGIREKQPPGPITWNDVARASLSCASGSDSSILPSPPGAHKPTHRVYVGNIPFGVTEVELSILFNNAMYHADCATTRDSVTSVYLNVSRRFAFIEFRTAQQATNCLCLDGLSLQGTVLQIRRPSGYNPLTACTVVGNTEKIAPTVNPAALGVVSTVVSPGPNKIYLGELPSDVTEDQVKELVSSFGEIRAFFLPRTENGLKNFCFFEYRDSSITQYAICGLDGLSLCGKRLVCKLAADSDNCDVEGSTPDHIPTSRVLKLCRLVTEEELRDNREYFDICKEIRMECEKYGNVLDVTIPRRGNGDVYVKYETISMASNAMFMLTGRRFSNREVVLSYADDEVFRPSS